MTAAGLWLRRTLLCVVGVLMCALLLSSGARASQSFELETVNNPVRSVDEAWMKGPISDELATWDGFRYMVYWATPNRSGHILITVARIERGGSGKEVEILEPRLANRYESNAVLKLGISPNDGRLHISWSEARGIHNYIQSSAECLAQMTFRNCTYSAARLQISNTAERTISSPEYFSDQNGNLFVGLLSGTDESGTYRLNRYNNNGTWTAVGDIIDGRTGRHDPDGGNGGASSLPEAEERTIHVDGIHFGGDGYLNIAWTYREWYDARPTLDAGLRTHDLYYAYSGDLGQSWRGSTGAVIADASRRDPITIADTTTYVYAIPSGWYRGLSRMQLDSNGLPHIVGPASEVRTWNPAEASYRQHHIWQTLNGSWHSEWVESPTQALDIPIRGDLIFNPGDDLSYVYARDEYGWVPWNGDATESDLPPGNLTLIESGLEILAASATTSIISTGSAGIPIGGEAEVLEFGITTFGAGALNLRVAWTTEESPNWELGRSQVIRLRPNSREQYVMFMSDPDWGGTLQQIQLEFERTVSEENLIRMEWMELRNRRLVAEWDFSQPAPEMHVAEAWSSTAWSNWEIYELFPEGNAHVALGDVGFAIDDRAYTENGRVDFVYAEETDTNWQRELAVYEFELLGDGVVKDWGFPQESMGWTANEAVSGFAWASDGGAGAIGGTVVAAGPAVRSRDDLGLSLETRSRWLHVRLKNTTSAAMARVWAKLGSEREFNIARSLSFAIAPRSGYTTYDINVSRIPGWERGTLKQLMILASDEVGIRSGSFKVDRVYIEES